MAKKIGSETVHVYRTPRVDRLSENVPATAEHDIEGCVILPRLAQGGAEEGKGWVIVEGKLVLAPFGADIQANDEVSIPDETGRFQVDGKPGPYKNKRGRGKVTMFYLKRFGT